MSIKYKSQGGEGMNVPVMVEKTFIYFHSNIEKHEDEDGRVYYTYDVEKMTVEEATKLLVLENIKLKTALAELAGEVYK